MLCNLTLVGDATVGLVLMSRSRGSEEAKSRDDVVGGSHVGWSVGVG